LVKHALRAAIASATKSEKGVCEVGGWAVGQPWRGSTVPITIALLIFALMRRLGRCIGIATATKKSNSAHILRRLGCTSFFAEGIELPPYYDSQYRCFLELLRFDSDIYDNRYARRIASAEKRLESVCVLSPALTPVANAFLNLDAQLRGASAAHTNNARPIVNTQLAERFDIRHHPAELETMA
jgi:hypothetical protein